MKLFRPSPGVITSGFGKRTGGIGSTNHKGLDFGWGNGWIVFAAQSGKVTFVGFVPGYGNLTTIGHGRGYSTRYAHQSRFKVTKGDKVTAGKPIGVVGNTGTSSGAHLHFELRRFGIPINPAKKFTALADGDIAPIREEEEEEDDEMIRPKLVKRKEGRPEWSLCAPWLDGGGIQQGYLVITDPEEAKAYARIYDRGFGNETQINRKDYIAIQEAARVMRKQWLADPHLS